MNKKEQAIFSMKKDKRALLKKQIAVLPKNLRNQGLISDAITIS